MKKYSKKSASIQPRSSRSKFVDTYHPTPRVTSTALSTRVLCCSLCRPPDSRSLHLPNPRNSGFALAPWLRSKLDTTPLSQHEHHFAILRTHKNPTRKSQSLFACFYLVSKFATDTQSTIFRKYFLDSYKETLPILLSKNALRTKSDIHVRESKALGF